MRPGEYESKDLPALDIRNRTNATVEYGSAMGQLWGKSEESVARETRVGGRWVCQRDARMISR